MYILKNYLYKVNTISQAYDDDDDDEGIRFIRYHYKVITLLVSARKINNNTINPHKKIKKLTVEVIRRNIKDNIKLILII